MIDDDPAIRDVMLEMKPELVLLDLLAPGLDGIDLLEEIRGDCRLMDIPVVIMTGDNLGKEETCKLNNELNAVISKADVTDSEVIEKIRSQVVQLTH